jgi:hypothetical protein
LVLIKIDAFLVFGSGANRGSAATH